MTRRASTRAVTHTIEGICPEEPGRALYWSDYERAWCHTDGWPCPALKGIVPASRLSSARKPPARKPVRNQHDQLALFTIEELS